jgi:murein tripeptide amidase MpaA
MKKSMALLLAAGGIVGLSCAGALAQGRDDARGGAGVGGAPEVVRYDGHKSVRVTVRTPRELMTALALTDDVLSCEGAGIGTFDVRYSPEQYRAFVGTGIEHEVLVDDLQAHIEAWRAANEQARQQDGGWYEAFRDLDEINARIDALAAAHPQLVTLSVIGESIEGRPIRMMRVTGPGGTEDRPAMFFNGTQHSRESLSPMTTMYFVEQLLEQYGTDPRTQALVDGIDFHIVPMANPDGYMVVWGSDPLWRKNRRITPGSTCLGVDLNRNWGHQWGNNNGSSGNPCDQTYRGAAAFSEPETQALSSVVAQLAAQGKLRAHLDIHSYGSLLLSPWGYTTSPPPPHLPTMNYLGAMMRDEIFSSRGTTYTYGQGSVVLYVVSGGSRDYSYGVHGAMGWTIELPGTNFHPPPAQILPVAVETRLGLMALSEFFIPRTPIFMVEAPGVATAGMPMPVVFGVSGADPEQVRLHWRTGTGWYAQVPAVHLGADSFRADVPPAQCGQVIQYYLSAQRGSAVTVYPAGGAAMPLEAPVYEATAAFVEDVEAAASAAAWTVTNFNLTAGAWQRAQPIGATQNGILSAPNTAYAGQWSFVTQNGLPGGAPGAADVDGGPTILTSPRIDLEGAAHAEISFGFWHYSVGGNVDVFTAEVSGDDGQTWSGLMTASGSTGWRSASVAVPAAARTANFRVRFLSVDNPNDSVTESGIDEVRVSAWACSTPPCYANCDQSTAAPVLNVDDFSCFINRFAMAQALPYEQQVTSYANCDGSTVAPVLNVDDFGCFINAFALGCN